MRLVIYQEPCEDSVLNLKYMCYWRGNREEKFVITSIQGCLRWGGIFSRLVSFVSQRKKSMSACL